jgi:hypothetical protein
MVQGCLNANLPDRVLCVLGKGLRSEFLVELVSLIGLVFLFGTV